MLRPNQKKYLNSNLQRRKKQYNVIDYDSKIRNIAKQELQDLALIVKRVENPSLDSRTRNNQRFKIFKHFLDDNNCTISYLIEGIVEACWDKAREIEKQRLISTHGTRHPVVRQYINDPKALTPHDAIKIINKHIIYPIQKIMEQHISQQVSIKIEFTFND